MAKKKKKPTEKAIETGSQNFTPSAEMKRWLSASFNLGYGANIIAVAKEAKVSRRSWYYWLETDEFVKWWDRMWQKHLLGMRWKLDAIGMKKAEKDYEYWKTMMERVGNLPRDQEDRPPGVSVPIQINLDKYVK